MVLFVILVAQYILRLTFQSPANAAASTAFLALFMAVCYLWGGWRSYLTAKKWLVARPFIACVISAGVAGILGLTLFNSPTNIPLVIVESIGAYFVFHAFCTVGDRIAARIRRSH